MTIGDEVDKLYRAHATYDARRIAKDKKIDILVMPLDSDTCGLTVRNSRFNTIILNELIEKIVVHEKKVDEDGSKSQLVEIHYKFVGCIDLGAMLG